MNAFLKNGGQITIIPAEEYRFKENITWFSKNNKKRHKKDK